MIKHTELQTINFKHRFLDRQKLMRDQDKVTKLTGRVRELLASGDTEALRQLLDEQYPADLSDVMGLLDDAQDKAVFRNLDTYEAAEVLDEVDPVTRENLLKGLSPDRIARLLEELPSDEGADIVGSLPEDQKERVLQLARADKSNAIRKLLGYPKESAGGLMSLGFVAVPETATVARAIEAFRAKTDAEPIFYIFVVDDQGALKGMLGLHTLLCEDPNSLAGDLMTAEGFYVTPDLDQQQVAHIFARYDLTALPVVEPQSKKLIGIITPEDVVDVLEYETTEDLMRIAGSDAEELEKRTPRQVAFLRLPWIMLTMFIELLAGIVIHYFDATLTSVILLASFMPIISAISGNTGLQSATIIVRGLDTGHVQLPNWRHAVLRQLNTTLILGAVTGLTLGAIGAIWYGKLAFGVVVALGMFIAVNIAGVVGTVVPLTSKHLGFDPAITSGPFETAFQDVVGISIFLGLATLMLHYLT